VTPGRWAPSSFDQEVADFPTQLDEDLKDVKDKGKAATPCSAQEVVDFLAHLDEDLKDYKDKGKAATPCSDQEVVDFLKLDEDLEDYKDKDKATTGTPDGHRSATSTGSGTAPTGAEPKQRHSNGGRGQQRAPPQGASDKTSGSVSISMPSSASPGISPESPAVHGPLPGDDETARLPSPVSRLPPLAVLKRPAGALSPTDVALFPTSRAPPKAA